MSGSDGVSRRRLLLGLGAAGAVGLGSGAGTRAALLDRGTIGGNHLRAGTVDLQLATVWLRRRPDEAWTAWDDGAETWRPYDGSGFADVGYASGRTVEPVVDDLREGHDGRVWTAFRVCDNPATVSVRLTGSDEDGDDSHGGDLADRVEGTLFYADSLDSLTEPTGATTLAAGSLRDLLGRSFDLSPGATGGASSDEPTALGKLEFDGHEGGDIEISLEGTVQSWSGSYPAGVETFVPEDDAGDPPTFTFEGEDGAVTVVLTRFYVKDAAGDDREVYAFDFETDAGSVCRVDVKGGSGSKGSKNGRGDGDGGVRVYRREDLDAEGRTELRPPANAGGDQAAISHVVFYDCPDDDPEPPACLPACEPAYLGLSWAFPEESGPDGGWFGDRVDLSLTFEAVQCRHRVGRQGGESS